MLVSFLATYLCAVILVGHALFNIRSKDRPGYILIAYAYVIVRQIYQIRHMAAWQNSAAQQLGLAACTALFLKWHLNGVKRRLVKPDARIVFMYACLLCSDVMLFVNTCGGWRGIGVHCLLQDTCGGDDTISAKDFESHFIRDSDVDSELHFLQ